jgi:hypothetical protein
MCLQLILRRVGPSVVSLPSVCPYENCQGRHFEHHQEVDKLLKDTGYGMVSAHRYRCLRCERTFRVYPLGVTRAQTSQRVKGFGVKQFRLAGAKRPPLPIVCGSCTSTVGICGDP